MKKFCPFLLAALLFIMGSITTKAQNGDVMLTTSSNQAMSAFKTGLRFFDLGDNKKAREFFQQAIEQDSKFALAYVYRALYSESAQEFVGYLNKAKENIGTANDWEKSVYEYWETDLTNNLDKRLEVAQKMVTQFSTSGRAFVMLGEVYGARKDFTKARESFQKATSVEPNWPGGYYALAESYMFAEPKDFVQAQAMASKVVNLAATGGTYILLGDTYRAQNNLAKAEEMYSKSVQLDATDPEALYKRGHARTFLGQFDNARMDYEQAGKLDVSPVSSRMFIAFTYLYQDQPQKALDGLLGDAQTITQGMDEAKSNAAKATLLTATAEIAAHTKNVQKLQEIFAMLKPLSEQIANSIGTQEAKLNSADEMLFWQGIAQVLNKDFTGATATAEQIKTTVEPIKSPNKLEHYEMLLGYSSLVQKNFSDAITHFTNTNPANVYNRYCLARAYEGAGQMDKAMSIYKDLANYNFNSIEYALIRSAVRKKVQ